jgi:hypothetical protein
MIFGKVEVAVDLLEISIIYISSAKYAIALKN